MKGKISSFRIYFPTWRGSGSTLHLSIRQTWMRLVCLRSPRWRREASDNLLSRPAPLTLLVRPVRVLSSAQLAPFVARHGRDPVLWILYLIPVWGVSGSHVESAAYGRKLEHGNLNIRDRWEGGRALAGMTFGVDGAVRGCYFALWGREGRREGACMRAGGDGGSMLKEEDPVSAWEEV